MFALLLNCFHCKIKLSVNDVLNLERSPQFTDVEIDIQL